MNTIPITEFPITNTLQRHGITRVTKEGNKINIVFDNGQRLIFQAYGNNIKKTIESFEHCASSVTTLDGDAKAAIKIYLANQTMRTAEAAPVSTEENEEKKEIHIQKYSNGRLAEAVLLSGKPCFLIADKEGNIGAAEQIELEERILKPLSYDGYLSKPYTFESKEQLDAYIAQAKTETIDSLYRKVKTIIRKYIDADDFHIAILAADIIYTYFQDRVGSTHYLYFIGNNSCGKSNNLKVIHELAYRNFYATDMTAANIYRFLGSDEEAQGTLCEDEADNIDEDREKMRIYKNGYTTGAKVPRGDSVTYEPKAYYTYCWKAYAAERLADSEKAKGFNERVIAIHCTPGFPQYDITEIVKPAGVEEFERLLNEFNETHKTLLVYRMLHYFDTIPQVKLANLNGREIQLFSPLVRLFRGTETLGELLPVISKYLTQRRENTANGLHAHIFSMVRNLVKSQQTHEIESAIIWQTVVNTLPGNEVPHHPQSYESSDYGQLSQKQITQVCMEILGAKKSKRHGEGRKLIFDHMKLERLSKFYDLNLEVLITDIDGTYGNHGTLFADGSYNQEGNSKITEDKDSHLSEASQDTQASQQTKEALG